MKKALINNKPAWIAALVIIVAAMLLIVGLPMFIRHQASPLIKLLVLEQSDGQYALSFDDINIHPLSKTLRVRNAQLQPVAPGDSATSVYVNLPDFEIQLESLRDLVFRRKLELDHLVLNGPYIEIINPHLKKEASQKSFSQVTGKLYQDILAFLEEVQIGNFSLLGAHVLYKVEGSRPHHYEIDSLSLLLENIEINQQFVSDTTQILFCENVELLLYHQSLPLADSIHMLQFDELHFSYADQLIQIENFSLTPDSTITDANLEMQNLLDIRLPNFLLTDLDFERLYLQNELRVDTIVFEKPYLDVELFKKVGTNKKSLNEVLLEYFDKVFIDFFTIQEARLSSSLKKEILKDRMDVQYFTCVLEEVDIAISEKINRAEDLNFARAYLDFEHVEGLASDSLHRFSARKFTLSTRDREITIDSLQVSANRGYWFDNESVQQKSLKTFDIPRIHLKGIAVRDFLFNNRLYAQSVQISHPEVALVIKKHSKKKKEARGIRSPLNELQSAFADFRVDSIQISNGDYEVDLFEGNAIVPLLKIQDMEMDILAIRLDSMAPLGLISNSFAINFGMADFHLGEADNELQLEGVSADLHYGNVRADGLVFEATSKKGEGNSNLLAMENIRVHHFNLPDFLFDQRIIADSVHLGQLHTSIKIPNNDGRDIKKTSPTPIRALSLQHFSLDKGSINLENQGKAWSLNIPYFTLDIPDLAYQDSDSVPWIDWIDHQAFLMNLNQLQFQSSQMQIRVDSLKANGFSDAISTYGISYRSVTGQSEQAVTVDHLDLTEWGVDSLSSGYWGTLNKIYLDGIRANIHMKNPEKETTAPAEDTTQIFPLAGLAGLRLDSVMLQNTQLAYTRASQEVLVDQLNLLSTHMLIDADGFSREKTLPFLADYRLDMGRLQVSSPDWAIRSENTMINTESSIFAVETFEYEHVGEPLESFNVNQLALTGLNYEYLWQKNALEAQALEVTSSSMALSTAKDSLKAKKPSSEANWTPLRIREINLYDHDIQLALSADTSMKINAAGLFVRNLDWQEKPEDMLHQALAMEANVVLPEITFYLKGMHADLTLNQIVYQLPTQKIEVDQLALKPRISKLEYAPYIGYQTDWINATTGKISLSGLDLEEMIRHKTYALQKVNIEDLQMFVFRDKRIPRPDNWAPPTFRNMVLGVKPTYRIDSLVFNNGLITYEEHPDSDTPSGSIFFSSINGSITGLTNNELLLPLGAEVEWKVRAKLYGEGDISLRATYPLDNEESYFKLYASVEDFPFIHMNQMLEPAANVTVRSGFLEQLTMRVEGDEDYARGQMDVKYEDLRINLISKKTNLEKGFGVAIESFLANSLIIRKNNNNLFRKRYGEVFAERRPDRSFFNYWSKIALSGVLTNTGVRSNRRYIKEINREIRSDIENQEIEADPGAPPLP